MLTKKEKIVSMSIVFIVWLAYMITAIVVFYNVDEILQPEDEPLASWLENF